MVDQPPEADEAPKASEAEEEPESKESRLRWLLGFFISLLAPVRPNVYVRSTDPVLTPRDLWLQYMKKNLKRYMIIAMWLGVTFGPLLLPHHTDYNEAAEARLRIVQAYEMKTLPESQRAEARRELSTTLLKSRAAKVQSDIDVGGDTPTRKHEIVLKVAQSSQTGQPIKLDTALRSVSIWDFLKSYGLAYVFFAYATLSLRYYISTYLKGEYIADLPWLRGWPLLFALFVTPWLIPGYIGSAIRLAYYKRMKRKAAAANEEVSTYRFESDEAVARKFYVDLRLTDLRVYIQTRLEAIQATLDEIAARAQARQVERSDLQAERRGLQNVDISTDIPDGKQAVAEFAEVIDHPDVMGVNRVGDELHVYVKARYRLDGVLYDLGDWLLKVGMTGLTSQEVRDGTKVKWHVYGHPIYRLRDGVFCFGPTTGEIAKCMEQGKIASAILLAVGCLNSINDVDLPNVPKAFKVVKEEG